MKANDRGLYIGGLMRCCIKTKDESTDETDIGSVLPCKYCTSKMYVAPDGNWRWLHEPDGKTA